MRYSPEALTAFVEAVDSGSFSAAARRLRKSQSTISTAIANLEADLGVTLFDRATRQPTLTPQGEQVLSYVKAILAASERLDELAVSLSGETEPRLTFVLSDTLHPDVLEDLLVQFDRRFPHTEFECLIGEDEDVIDLLQKSRAQVGLIEARERYPTDIGSTRLPLQTAMGIYVAPGHPLAAQGFGWCILPSALVAEFAPQGGLVALDIPGWPRAISVDLLWNKKAPPGAAGSWLRQHLQRRER
ncbi:TPA: LysR family transcriptional regulator [Klebsiella pneumoniae]|uniref:LysR family transcriptional regulator n=1 Tax=Klebsiella pneumoniae TaxID=573 RepID=UPI0021530420|nr:LysR family transcriptional regulator [Klebsiella pneumoniae]HBZ7325880.1 LysR family transcriptional regulator [Klebsiella pneumoniae]HBZ7351586.1 LysR family transcriptional regulator [Klebsiella pneumoniae]HBZ7937711.1 LysR family transcriptional regulator [Klebsiella pneumoniae]